MHELNRTKNIGILIMSLLLTGCFHTRSSEVHNSYLSWSGYCFDGYHAKAESMLAGSYRNCGFFSINQNTYPSGHFYRSFSNGLTCVADAMKSNKPFLIGIHSLWRDSYVCESYLLSNDGRIYRQFLDFDVYGQLDTSGESAAYYEQVCESIEIKDDPINSYALNHISGLGCVEFKKQVQPE